MIRRLRGSGLLWPTLLALLGLIVLIGLGTWQISRKVWKAALLHQIAEQGGRPPVALAEALRMQRDGEPIEYLRVRLQGRFLHAHEMHFFAPYPPVKGWLIFTPLVLADRQAVMVNRGAVPESLKDPASRPAGQLDGVATVIGRIRLPEARTTFTPADDPLKNIWQRRDPLHRIEAIAAGNDIDAVASPRFYLDTDAEPANPGGWPRGGTTNVKLSNRHLEYAITWYGIALTLAGVYVAYAASRLRQSG